MPDIIKERLQSIISSRLTVMYIVMLLLGGVLLYRCFSLQIVNGQTYLDNFVLEQEKTRDIASSRGNIYDCNGKLLAYSELAYSVKIEDTFETGKQKNQKLNELALTLLRLIEKNGDRLDSNFKIYINKDGIFEYSVSGKALERFLADVYDHTSTSELTAEEAASTPLEVMRYLSRPSGNGYYYRIGDYADPNDKNSFEPGLGLTKKEWLGVMNIRYSMSRTAYRKYIGTTIATDVSDKTVATILENADILPGVTIEEGYVRKYVDSFYFAQLLGYTGRISSDELADLNQQAYEQSGVSEKYSINDVVGKSGIEAALENTLQGNKGYERVMVDSTGKVISILEKNDPKAGNDVYLTIDMDLTKAVYNIVEQKLAGLVASKIINAKEYIPSANSTSSDIRIPIYDVYFAAFNNNLLDMGHMATDDAMETEAKVYSTYIQYHNDVYEKIRNELFEKRTIYSRLNNEYKAYESTIVQMLISNGVLDQTKMDPTDEMVVNWTTNENISLGAYLEYCISQNWVDVSKLSLDSKYSDSSELFSKVVEEAIREIDQSSDFQKKIYKYMLLGGTINGSDVCLLLWEQNVIQVSQSEIDNLKNGRLSAYQFMMNRIQNLDITPAQLALDPCNASVVITDVGSGKVLAMVTYPGYDNNKMANSVDTSYYEKLTNDKSSPLLNFATQYKAAPGSTFKPVSATAGLLEGVINTNTRINCVGLFESVTPSPRCWSHGHGQEIVRSAIRDSCNYFFYEVGYRLATVGGTYNDTQGLNTLYKYADIYGLSDKSGVEISEYAPDVSDTDAVRSAIGQGTHSYTTTQLARYVTAIANKGTCYQLTLVDHVTDPAGYTIKEFKPVVRNTIELSDEYWRVIRGGMRDVVLTKTYYDDCTIEVSGKTGTAQQISTRPSHALFVCYAPSEDPEIAMATRVPFGYSSDYAAQISKDIINYYFEAESEEDLINGRASDPEAGVTNEL